MIAVLVEPARGERRCLLVRPRGRPEVEFGPVTGYVQAGESLEDAVRREVWETTGLDVDHMIFEESRAWPDPDLLVVGFRARTTANRELATSGSRELRWFTREELHERFGGGAGILDEPETESMESALLREWAWGGA